MRCNVNESIFEQDAVHNEPHPAANAEHESGGSKLGELAGHAPKQWSEDKTALGRRSLYI
jgi:hypothetical protein